MTWDLLCQITFGMRRVGLPTRKRDYALAYVNMVPRTLAIILLSTAKKAATIYDNLTFTSDLEEERTAGTARVGTHSHGP